MSYKAFGGLGALVRGNGLHETTEYNGRQQQWWRGLGTAAGGGQLWKEELVYGAGTANNGNVVRAELTFPSGAGSATASTRFDYDKANRLTMAIEGWSPTALPATGEGQTAATNRITGTIWGYDSRGNLTSMPAGSGLVNAFMTARVILTRLLFLAAETVHGAG